MSDFFNSDMQLFLDGRVDWPRITRLRRVALMFGAGIPAAAMVLLFSAGGTLGIALAVIAALSGLLGALIERWLFFAEATHTVMLYYREQRD